VRRLRKGELSHGYDVAWTPLFPSVACVACGARDKKEVGPTETIPETTTKREQNKTKAQKARSLVQKEGAARKQPAQQPMNEPTSTNKQTINHYNHPTNRAAATTTATQSTNDVHDNGVGE